MEPLTLKPRQPVKEDIECWDDDEDLQGIDDLQFRNISSTTVGTSTSAQATHHRDSITSRGSTRSEIETDEDWQVLLPTDDELSTTNAITSAKIAGIPIPSNVPTSALLGGTIKRLGGRRLKMVLGDDWGEDLELPKPEEGGLKLRMNNGEEFPDALRHISNAFSKTPSPAKPQVNMTFMERLQSAGKAKATTSTLDKFRDDDGDDDFGDAPTIKVVKNRPAHKVTDVFGSPIKLAKPTREAENFEDDLEFPTDGKPLQLSARKEIPKTPAAQSQDDFDSEWAEGSQGSLGTSLGGTRRTGRSNRSSSVSALSPSVFSPSLSSCLTAESEDEGLGGLVLPDGPLKFEEALKKRLENASPDPTDGKKSENRVSAKEDFFSGIEIGDGDVFDSAKLTLNRNIKHKSTRQTSPKRTAMTLTFTNKPSAVTTRIPKPAAVDRPRSKLEPVSESGLPLPLQHYSRSQSRLGGHSSQSSVSSIPTPSTPSFPPISGPSTPSRRGLTSRSSREMLRMDATTTSAQLLKAKRSMPVMRTQPSPGRSQPSYQRPSSRTEKHSRNVLPRPKTPVDRSGAESSLGTSRKPPVPFIPAGNTNAQSHHISSKSSRNFRPNSSDSNENVPFNRSISRLSNPQYRPHTPTRRDVAPESLVREAASKRTLTKPTRRRAFGDGSELDIFDDLPTSATLESKFVKQPIARGPAKPSTLRNKLYSMQNHSLTSLGRTETPVAPPSPMKHDSNVPSFARDTAASRLAREQRVAALNPQPLRNPGSTPLAPISTNWKAHVVNKPLPSPRHNPKRSNKPVQKPQLIKPLGNSVSEPKNVKNMHWNPHLFRWEGNEHVLAPFDVPLPVTPGSPKHGGLHVNTKPALIANVGTVKGVQVVGGMVFDRERMCWLKMGNPGRGRSDSTGMSPATDDDEEDPFAGLDDLEDGEKKGGFEDDTAGKGRSLVDDEWLVGEEFDIGPEFKRRQKAEEEKWRKKMEIWNGERVTKLKESEGRWALREWMEKW